MSGLCRATGLGTALLLGTTAASLDANAQSPNWTFFYVGAHAGYDWNNVDTQGFGTIDANGFAGGLLAGVNFYQSGNFVAGVEADITWMHASGSASNSTPFTVGLCGSTAPFVVTTIGADVNWKASLRGRTGYLINPTTLVFATAGVAWADVDLSYKDPIISCSATSASTTFFGGVVGGGTETQLGANLYGRIEVLHYFFENETVQFGNVSTNFDLDETVARAAIILRLN